MKIYIDGELPKSCASCQFLIHCDECEGAENYCPFIGCVGYDLSDTLIDGAPVTPSWERHEECPLEQRPHGEWIFHKYDKNYECSNCHVRLDKTQIYTEKRFENALLAKMEIYNFCPNCGASMRKEGDEK